MAKKEKRAVRLKQKLIHKYRLVILNEDTFQERFSLKLSRLNVFVLTGVFSVLLITLTAFLIAFTPIKEYIPGYSSTALKKKATRLTYQADSLKQRLEILENFTIALKPVLTGDIKPQKVDSIKKEITIAHKVDLSKLNASKEDSLFREKVESKDRFPLVAGRDNRAKVVFFAPVNGMMTQHFDRDKKHFAVDIVARKGTPVKAIASGSVVLSEWTAETGYVIAIQHADNFLSVYKHNGEVMKQEGDFVKLGEVVASVGSTGELTTGPHLHFELWSNGYPVNPLHYIDFQ